MTNSTEQELFYFDKETKSFYSSFINSDIPSDAILISREKYNELLSVINSNCIIFDDLTYSEPKPSQFHEWNGNKWIENLEEKKQTIVNCNESKKSELMKEAAQNIAILQDAIDLDMALDGDEDKLKAWKKYRVLLSRVDTSVENMELPTKPN